MRKISSLLPLAFITAVLVVGNYFLLKTVTSRKPVTAPKLIEQATEGDSYLTIMFGRSQWTFANDCNPIAGVKTLEEAAIELKGRGKVASGIVITDWAKGDNSRLCRGGVLYSNWNDLGRLRDTYGWTFVSGGLNHSDLTAQSMSNEEKTRDVRSSLEALKNHGHEKAWALYAYADNKFTPEIQRNIVSPYYSYGRTYTYSVRDTIEKNEKGEMVVPWFQKTNDILGGKCNADDHSLPCYTLSVRNNRRYVLADTLADMVKSLGPNEWLNLQFFSFVDGKKESGAGPHWNCEGSDAASRKLHWTDRTELYCWNDLKYILNNIPASVQVATPDVVATAWGRTPPFEGGGGNPPPSDVGPPAGGGALKPPMQGVITRDGMAAEAYRDVVNGFVVNVRWSQLQPNSQSDEIAHPNPIDQAIEQARSYNNSNPNKPKMQVKARLFTGTEQSGNFWANRIGGEPLHITNTNSRESAYIGRFWLPSYKQAYDNLQQKLAAEYDDDPEFRDITISRCMLVFAEPFLKTYAERELLAAGWTRELDFDCQKDAIDSHRVWTTTHSSLTVNPALHYSEAMDYCRERLGSRCILENNSYRSDNQGPAYVTMYNKMKTKGPPIALQTAQPSRIGDWKEALRKAVELGSNAVELNSAYRTYDMNELLGFDRQLEGNPICSDSNCDIPPPSRGGLTGFYYSLTNFNGFVRREDPVINLDWEEATPGVGDVGSDNFGVVWVGDIVVPQTGTYTFYTQSDEAVQLWVGGNLVVSDLEPHTVREDSGQVTLSQGQHYPIKVSFFELTGPSSMKLLLSGPSVLKQIVPQGYLFPFKTASAGPE